DPLLAKLTVWGETRSIATARMRRALDETAVEGIMTNVAFFREILRDQQWEAGDLHTGFIDDWFARRSPVPLDKMAELAVAIAAIKTGQKSPAEPHRQSRSEWLSAGRDQMLR
ncbi:MAG: acetyl-CoA carboxylase biotin carboxylase subunit, partial [Bryobacteraceae bacterium]|nr:acetyl-CoA carboxylase biotin carboxylase subunit [Bryobacteraceae bacterium]